MTWLDEKGIDPRDVAEKFMHSPNQAIIDTWNEHVTYARGDTAFAVWLAYVDRRMRAITGVSIYDLPDFTWRDEFDSDASPQAAVRSFAASEPF